MHKEVKSCADKGDIKGLKYIFVDCLDVDPTFEKYKEDYEYCKNLNGLFESHRELTPFSMDKSLWNYKYWQKLKTDLLKNFSDSRFKHMIEVAKIVYSDKIERILKERENSLNMNNKKINESGIKTSTASKIVTSSKLEKENQQSMLEEERRRIQIENRKTRAKEKADIERIEKLKEQASQAQANKNSDSKKLMGVVVGTVLIILAIVLIINLI